MEIDVFTWEIVKKCPYCKSKARLLSKQIKFKGQNDFGAKIIRYAYYIMCNKCRASGPRVYGDVLTETTYGEKQRYELAIKAIKLWNGDVSNER